MTTARVVGILVLTFTGCASSLPAWTAAQVGCPAEEVVILNEEKVWSTRTWTALCRGKTYACSERNEGQSSVSCNESNDAPDGSSAQKRPCQFDTQCSGERRCRDGYCVNPASPAPPPHPAETP